MEESENNNRSRASLFVPQQRPCDIPAGRSEVSLPALRRQPPRSAHNHTRTARNDTTITFSSSSFFFLFTPSPLLGCYPEHSNLIRPFDKHLTQSSGLLSRLPTAQGKRLRLTNFHPQFSLFYLHLSNSMPVSVTQRWGKSKPLSSLAERADVQTGVAGSAGISAECRR